jgi:hypothetical protein
MKKICVYTTLFGEYEEINAQSIAKSAHIDFVCLTDNKDFISRDWQTRLVSRSLENDPIRSQRLAKVNPHLYLGDYDLSLYIDNTVELLIDPEEVIGRIWMKDRIFSVPLHSFRNTLQEEFIEVVKWGLDDYSRVWEQNNHYIFEAPEIMIRQPLWTGLLVREHHDPRAIKIAEQWSQQILRYSRRDQLSLPYVLNKNADGVYSFDLDNHKSDLHKWPIHNKRNVYLRDDSVKLSAAPIPALQVNVYNAEFRNDQLRLDNQDLTGERDQLRLDNQDLTGERDQLRLDNQDLTGERDQLRLDNQDLTGERDQLRLDNQDLNDYVKATFTYKFLSRMRIENGKLHKIIDLLS